MKKELKEHFDNWSPLSRDLLWKVMSFKEKGDSSFHDESSPPAMIKQACSEMEEALDEIKELLKKLYLVLYEIDDVVKADAGKSAAPSSGPATLAGAAPAPQTPQPRVFTPKNISEPPKPKEPPTELKPPPIQVMGANPVQAAPKPGAPALEKLPVPEYTIPEKQSGLLEYLGQWSWFLSLPKEKKDEVVAIMCSDEKITPHDVMEREVKTLRPQFASYCWKIANKLMKRGHDELATGLLIKGLTVVTQKRDKEMLHVMYAKYFYRQRKVLKNAYDACVNHCEKAIKSYLQDKEDRPKPVAPFKLLTMIYEEQGDLSRIIDVSDKAISLYQGTPDESKVIGFIRIKDILEKREKEAAGGKGLPPPQLGKMMSGGDDV